MKRSEQQQKHQARLDTKFDSCCIHFYHPYYDGDDDRDKKKQKIKKQVKILESVDYHNNMLSTMTGLCSCDNNNNNKKNFRFMITNNNNNNNHHNHQSTMQKSQQQQRQQDPIIVSFSNSNNLQQRLPLPFMIQHSLLLLFSKLLLLLSFSSLLPSVSSSFPFPVRRQQRSSTTTTTTMFWLLLFATTFFFLSSSSKSTTSHFYSSGFVSAETTTTRTTTSYSLRLSRQQQRKNNSRRNSRNDSSIPEVQLVPIPLLREEKSTNPFNHSHTKVLYQLRQQQQQQQADNKDKIVIPVQVRELQQQSSSDNGMFQLLDCNKDLFADVDDTNCQLWSVVYGTNQSIYETEFIIPCGTCIIMDYYDNNNNDISDIDNDNNNSNNHTSNIPRNKLIFKKGLNIIGKLIISDDIYNNNNSSTNSSIVGEVPFLRIETTMLIVQGSLLLSFQKSIIGKYPMFQLIMITSSDILKHDQDHTFIPHDNNQNICGYNSVPCLVGQKGIVIAGGQFHASGIPDHTPTWLNVYDIGRTFTTSYNNDTTTTEVEEEGEELFLMTDEIIVNDMNVLNGWGIGAELLFPSYTMEWYQSQTNRIVNITKIIRRTNTTTLTSNENDNHEDDDDEDDYYVLIVLERPISALLPTVVSTTFESTDRTPSSNFAVEIALLSRNIVFDGMETITTNNDPNNNSNQQTNKNNKNEDDDKLNYVGGHIMFMYTALNTTSQYMNGIEIIHFGQQSRLGRYPIHFHFCHNTTNDIIQKNTIRHSFQRCIVIHGTNNVVIQDNIAYDTAGHCYMLEDGIETNNTFDHNLGCHTKRPVYTINKHETDHRPSTFWITNPTNQFSYNVAGGSEASGFWFETMKRGLLSNNYPHLDPPHDPLTLFENNVAHSNSDYGIRTYPQSYQPRTIAHMDKIQVYKNKVGGIFLHGSHNITLSNSIFADNQGVQIDIDNRADNNIIQNVVVIGYTESFYHIYQEQKQQQQQQQQMNNNTSEVEIAYVCDYDRAKQGYVNRSSSYGIEIHTWKENIKSNGVQLMNITFKGFNPKFTSIYNNNKNNNNTNNNTDDMMDPICDEILPFHIDKQTTRGVFDMYTRMSGIHMEGSRGAIDFCNAESNFLDDVYITILDGTFNQTKLLTSNNAPSITTILSNTETMTKFIVDSDKRCTVVPQHCFVACHDSCFTTRVFDIPPINTENYQLKVCQGWNTSSCIYIQSSIRVADYGPIRHRSFLVHLPNSLNDNQYSAMFLDENLDMVWPEFVHEKDEGPACPNNFTKPNIILFHPTLENEDADRDKCTDLIQNQQMEDINTSGELSYWIGRHSLVYPSIGIGLGKSTAITVTRGGSHSVLMQYLDTRCFKQQAALGTWYELSAYIKMTDKNGQKFRCYDVNDESNNDHNGDNICPDIGLQSDLNSFQYSVASVHLNDNDDSSSNSMKIIDGYHEVKGMIQINTTIADAIDLFLYVKFNSTDQLLVVDDVRMRMINMDDDDGNDNEDN